jgi:hypothetical protein
MITDAAYIDTVLPKPSHRRRKQNISGFVNNTLTLHKLLKGAVK